MISAQRPWLSIVIPAYNSEKYIQECLQSITNNNLDGVEILVINDGSTDHTLDICRKWTEKCSIIRVISKKNEGPSSARQFGMLRARGIWNWFVDSDDLISSDAVITLYKVLKHVKSDVINVGYSFFTDQKDLCESNIGKLQLISMSSDDFRHKLYQGKFQHFTQTYLFKNSFLKRLDYDASGDYAKQYPFIPGLSLYEDVVGIEGMLNSISSINVLFNRVYYIRRNPESLTHLPSNPSAMNGLKAIRLNAKIPTPSYMMHDKVLMEVKLLFSAYKLIVPNSGMGEVKSAFRKEIAKRMKIIHFTHLDWSTFIRYFLFVSRIMDVIICLRYYCHSEIMKH